MTYSLKPFGQSHVKTVFITVSKLSLERGNVFTRVCHSVHGGGGGVGGVSVYGVTACLADWSHVPSIAGVSLSWGSLYTGLKGAPSPDRDPLYGNERAIRILLEWFLVSRYYVFQNFVLLRLRNTEDDATYSHGIQHIQIQIQINNLLM